MTEVPFILPSLIIESTTAYTYHNASTAIKLLQLGDTKPQIIAYSMFIYNGTNETVTIQPIANQNNGTKYPDFNIAPSTTVASSTSALVLKTAFVDLPIDKISANVSFATIPTSGKVYGYMNIYYNHSY